MESPNLRNSYSDIKIETGLRLLSLELTNAFPSNNLIFAAIGSYGREYKSSLFSDLDLLAIALEKPDTYIDLESLDRLSLSFRKVSLALEKENVFLFGFEWYATHAYGLDLARYNLSLEKGYRLEEMVIVPVNFVFYSSMNGYFLRNYDLLNFWMEEYGNVTFLLGKDKAGEVFEILQKRWRERRVNSKMIDEIQDIIKHMEISFIEFRANEFLPIQLLTKESIRNVNVAFFNAARAFLREKQNLNTRSFKDINAEIERLPGSARNAVEKINEMNFSSTNSENDVIDMYRACAAAINDICVSLIG